MISALLCNVAIYYPFTTICYHVASYYIGLLACSIATYDTTAVLCGHGLWSVVILHLWVTKCALDLT